MKIGIIGAGRIGGTAAGLFARAGHEVALSNSRGPASLSDLVATINRDAGGSRVHASTVADAARFGDLVLLAAPWRAQDALPDPNIVRAKIVIDAMNAYGESGGFWWHFVKLNGSGFLVCATALTLWLLLWRRIRRLATRQRWLAVLVCALVVATDLVFFIKYIR